MKRRDAMVTGLFAALGATALNVKADEQTIKEEIKMEGGWQYKELEYEKHIPEVTVIREGDVAVITVQVKHPQTAEHHISAFRIYDENRIEITEFNLHPEKSLLRAVFYLRAPEGSNWIAITDCNIHGIWMKKFQA